MAIRCVTLLFVATVFLWVSPPATAVPPPLPLDEALGRADLVVVGELGRLQREHPDTSSPDVVGIIRVTRVLKGPAQLTRVRLRTLERQLPGPVKYNTGDRGIWILTRTDTEGVYEGGNPTSLQPISELAKVRSVLSWVNRPAPRPSEDTKPSNGRLREPQPPPDNSRPPEGRRPDDSGSNATWEHVRVDEAQLKERGDGSVDEGMNRLGERGYELFIVTSVSETGAAGFHYFKRPPWNRPLGRPVFQYRRIDTGGIAELGDGVFQEGLNKIEREGWELVAVTTTNKGTVGFHYFKRMKR